MLFNKRIYAFLLTIFLLATNQLYALDSSTALPNNHLSIVQTSGRIQLEIKADDLIEYDTVEDETAVTRHSLPGEQMTSEVGKPSLPMISRYLVVPPDAGLTLDVAIDNPIDSNQELYPSQPVTISDPVIIRGVRLVHLKAYPLQQNLTTGEVIKHESLNATINFTNDEPVNPVTTPLRRNRSPEFIKMIQALASNGDQISRDYGEIGTDYVGHYLIVSHEECLPYAIQLIEWKRRAGFKVDVITLTDQEAEDAEEIGERIQDLYDSYLNSGIDPFDNILILGDRASREGQQDNGWVVESHFGNPSQVALANHADYEFGLLEGDDYFPDVVVGRFGSGTEDRMEVAVARTLAYEMTPRMENPDWLDRAGVFTQKWGEGWSRSINYTTIGWGREVLRRVGFEDIYVQEADPFQDDGHGDIIGPILADWLNDGMSIMFGRAENLYWRNALTGVEENDVFPIVLNTCAHGEFAMHNMFRTGRADSLLGAVAMISSWGALTTIPNNTLLMSMANGVLLRDMTIGWSKVYAGGTLYSVLDPAGIDQTYRTYMTDLDLYGDPGLKPWIGVPKVVSANFPATVSTAMNQRIEVEVLSEDEAVADAQVTLYLPGDLPNPEDYADWNPIYMITTRSDANGIARFNIDQDLPEGTLYVTVTGRDIYPLRDEIDVSNSEAHVGVSDFSLQDNGDALANPGESITLQISATNYGQDDVNAVTARIVSESPNLTINDDNIINFGNIPSGESVTRQSAQIEIDPSCPNASEPILRIDFTSNDGEQSWQSSLALDIYAPELVIEDVIDIIHEETEFNIGIRNIGRIPSGSLTAMLLSNSWSVKVLDAESTYENIQLDSLRYNDEEMSFTIDMLPQSIPGSMADLTLVLTSETGFIDSVRFQIKVNDLRENTPQGPDAYGYVCIDDTDDEWQQKHDYQWIGIGNSDPRPRLNGDRIDFGDDVLTNAAAVLDLPFTFRYYGEEYDQLTVCINGFMTPGDQVEAVNYQNYPMELGIAGGNGTIAPFWNHLTIDGDNAPGIFYYYYQPLNIFIVEWLNVHYSGVLSHNLIFQAIIYDPEFHPTPTGDSEIVFQYRRIFQHEGADRHFATIGISNPDGTTGLTYSFKQRQPINGHQFEDSLTLSRAIKFTTVPQGNPMLKLDQSSINEREFLQPDQEHERPLILTNTGDGAISYTVSTDRRVNWITMDHLNDRIIPGDTTELILSINTAGLAGDDSVNVIISDGWIKTYSVPIRINVSNENEIPDDNSTPYEWSLNGNYPNPFNSTTTIHYTVRKSGIVKLEVLDLNGRLVETVLNAQTSAGAHTATFHSDNLASGVYLYRLSADSFTSTQKMILLK